MKRIVTIIATTITILTLSLVLGIATSRNVRAAVSALVTVVNTPANPVPVTEVVPAQPFQSSCNSAQPGSDFNGCTISSPAGKRLVIQNVSVRTYVDLGVRVSAGDVQVTYNGVVVGQYLPVPYAGPLDGNDINETVHELHLYGDSGMDSFRCSARYNATSTYNLIDCAVVGYLVDLP